MRTSLRGRGSRSPVRPGWAVQEGRGGSSGAEQLLGGTGGDTIASRDSDTWGESYNVTLMYIIIKIHYIKYIIRYIHGIVHFNLSTLMSK